MRLSYPGNSALVCFGKADVRRLYRILLDLTPARKRGVLWAVFFDALWAERIVSNEMV